MVMREPHKTRQTPKAERVFREPQVRADGVRGDGPREASLRGRAVQAGFGRSKTARGAAPPAKGVQVPKNHAREQPRKTAGRAAVRLRAQE